MGELIKAREVAKMFGTSEITIYTWARKGILPSVKLGNRFVRFDREAMEEILKRGRLDP